ncbi:nicotinate-nucleotide--dimethylbenzimidazole phosphoribosyltransferase [Thermoactinomyces sp. AMNI-1]|uniref:Nicotinate-nucleotide--dimethylbenzimidazole phosphoribosyltransferase n=2 Tax=Thermoactinomyces mirandus TaxID=2756294 RepID=A0A7W1XR37_9BACL|nr:nicotinate-nucleotide--dimethylbenzimidazole phosphoribosyltransferase [Thermoactinomyces mirandus]
MADKMKKHVDQLTKPVGSLGQLEEIMVRLAAITGEMFPELHQKAVVIFCGDHGVAEEGVSAYPQEATALMIQSFDRGKAAINLLAKRAGAELCVVDVGSKLEEVPESVVSARVRKGTRNFCVEKAMTEEEVMQAIQTGRKTVCKLREKGVRLLAVGELGIGNTTAGAAVASALTGMEVKRMTGRGSGLSDSAYAHKCRVIEKALLRHRPDPDRPLEVLAQVGGLEIAGMAGAYIGAAENRMPVITDGFISTVAALAAARWKPEIKSYLFASHASVEPGHSVILKQLGLKPLLHADMRLGEGSGAALAMPIFETAVTLAREMATFADLGLAGPSA